MADTGCKLCSNTGVVLTVPSNERDPRSAVASQCPNCDGTGVNKRRAYRKQRGAEPDGAPQAQPVPIIEQIGMCDCTHWDSLHGRDGCTKCGCPSFSRTLQEAWRGNVTPDESGAAANESPFVKFRYYTCVRCGGRAYIQDGIAYHVHIMDDGHRALVDLPAAGASEQATPSDMPPDTPTAPDTAPLPDTDSFLMFVCQRCRHTAHGPSCPEFAQDGDICGCSGPNIKCCQCYGTVHGSIGCECSCHAQKEPRKPLGVWAHDPENTIHSDNPPVDPSFPWPANQTCECGREITWHTNVGWTHLEWDTMHPAVPMKVVPPVVDTHPTYEQLVERTRRHHWPTDDPRRPAGPSIPTPTPPRVISDHDGLTWHDVKVMAVGGAITVWAGLIIYTIIGRRH